jgi:uncharacterized protein YndB with AHSA1/START domain
MMHANRLAGALAALALVPATAHAAAPAPERSWRDFKEVTNTSYTEPNGDRALQLSIEVPAPAHDIYATFTTGEGYASWAVPVAQVDFRVGGSIESSYDAHAKPGDAGNIRNEIVAYLPDRLLVLRNVQAPPGFPDAALFQKTVTVIEFQPLAPARTRVVITNAGYGPGERYAALYRAFEWGDAYELAQLRSRFEQGPVDWRARERQEQAEAASSKVTQADSK